MPSDLDKIKNLPNTISNKLDESGLSEELILNKIKSILEDKPKRIYASDQIKLIELYAKMKGWIKAESIEQPQMVQQYVNMPISELKVQIANIVKEVEEIESDDKK